MCFCGTWFNISKHEAKKALQFGPPCAILFRMTAIDEFDRAILRILQKDARTPQREIGKAVNLSAPAVQRRIKRLEEQGVIFETVAQVTPEAVGLPVTLIVEVELVSETLQDIDEMKNRLSSAPEVQQCYYVTGEADFVLVVIVESMASYEDFTRRHFFQRGNVKKFRTFVSMDAVKRTTALNI
jgi:Lrp/AsnC family transcriptional regulator, leucine-responsive regulatory protein